MKLRKTFISKIIEEGVVDTRKYRYILYSDYLIKRAPLDRLEYPDAWEDVYELNNENDIDFMI